MIIQRGNLRLDTAINILSTEDFKKPLTPALARVLAELLTAHSVVSRRVLIARITNGHRDSCENKAVDVAILRLRRILAEIKSSVSILVVTAVGFIAVPPDNTIATVQVPALVFQKILLLAKQHDKSLLSTLEEIDDRV